MGLRIECGRHPNDGFRITNAQTGEDLTEQLLIKDLDVLITMAPNRMNTVRMNAYVDSLDVMVEHVEVSLVEKGKEPNTELWKDHEMRELKDEFKKLSNSVRRVLDNFDPVFSRDKFSKKD